MFFIVVVSSALGFSFTDAFGGASAFAKGCLLVLLALFLAVNVVSIWNNLAIYNEAVVQLQAISPEGSPLGAVAHKIRVIPREALGVAHALFSLLALGVLYWRSFG